ncbi:tetratricopeptide repeat protein [uncultured Winogradskyella sp.]|uniref:tetratricopeptide repeat protein n=1 Tax=uncultured Winogradskyella sp. TaxID=395353 RepID=UPI002602C45B|nr:tetratricopeptide repeat protein [uncultured Winogradskyella sp.]
MNLSKALRNIPFSILILIFILSTLDSHCQDKKRVDSILNSIPKQHDTLKIESYRQLNMEYIYVDPKISKPYLDKAIALAKQYNVKDQIAQTTNDLGVYYAIISDFENSIKTIDIAIELQRELNDSASIAEALNNKGIILDDLGNFDDAIATHIEALKIKEAIKSEPWNIAYSYYNIGYSYNSISNFEMSNTYLEKAKAIFSTLTNYEEEINATNSLIANNLKHSKQYEKAIAMYKEIIPQYKAMNYNNDLAGAYNSLGQIYMETDSISKAKKLFEKSLDISKNYEQKALVALNLSELGNVELRLNNNKKALLYYEEALTIDKETQAKDNIKNDYLDISKAQAKLGNYEKAYENHLSFFELHDELLNTENIERINELEIQYQTEKKEKELIIKENEIKLLEERKKKAENEKLFLIISLIGALSLAIAIVYGLRQRMKRNKIEREKLDNDLAFKEKELTTHALHLAHKNEVLLDLKSQLKELKSNSPNSRSYQKVINTINLDINNDNNWEQFRNYFEDVHRDFNSKVKRSYPEVSNNDLRLMSLLKMNLSSKEIANILNISIEGVKKARYRLRKKLNLSTEESLQELVIEL